MASDDGVPRSQVSVKTVMTVSFTVLGVVALTYVVIETKLAISMALAAALVATALHHGVDVLTRRGVRRSLALAIVIVAVLALLTGVALLLVPPAVKQASALVAEIPRLMRWIQQVHVVQFVRERLGIELSGGSATSAVQSTAESTLRAVAGVIGGIATLSTIFTLTVFMLIFGRRIALGILAEAEPERRPMYERLAAKIYASIGGYLAGLSMVCAANATFTTLFLALARVPFFLPLGLLSGLASVVPYAGPFVAAGTITLLSLVTRGPWIALGTMLYFIVYGQIEGQLFGPLVYRKTVDVDPLITLLAILFMAELAGIIGAVIAVPAAAAGQVVLREFLAMRREKWRA